MAKYQIQLAHLSKIYSLDFVFGKKIMFLKILISVTSFSITSIYAQKLYHTELYNDGNIKTITYFKKYKQKIEKIRYEEYYENGNKKRENLKENS